MKQLLWLDDANSSLIRLRRAPSWSWASLDAGVKFLRVDKICGTSPLSVEGFWSSAASRGETNWTNGPCVLATRCPVIQWQPETMKHVIERWHEIGIDRRRSEIAGNSDHLEALKQGLESNRIKILWSSEALAANGWFLYDDTRQLDGPIEDNTHQFEVWHPLGNGTKEPSLKQSDFGKKSICVPICSYTPNRRRGKENVAGNVNHFFLVLESVGESRLYMRVGIGEIFLDDLFENKRVSEAKLMSFLGRDERILII